MFGESCVSVLVRGRTRWKLRGRIGLYLLLDRVRDRIRLKHYSFRTEQAYCDWIKRFILFHGKRHPSGLGAAEVEAFLTSLAVEGRVAASTQNQAKSALLFLYKEVLGVELAVARRRRDGARRRRGCRWS